MGVREIIAKALMGAVGGPNKLGRGGIDVYHSSPHTFDKFDTAKIGTGEGAQVYGHGLYFAENPAVSGRGGQYWDNFMERFKGPEATAARELAKTKFDRETAIERLNRQIQQGDIDPRFTEERAQALKLLQSGAPVGPRTYEVNIKADPVQFLDWDKPLQGQSPNVWKALRENDLGDVVPEGRNASELVQSMQRAMGKERPSQIFSDLGIPGIKYLDEGSRISSPGQIDLIRQNIAQREALLAKNPGNPTDTKWLTEYQDMLHRATNPTSNYVVFDPANIDIRKMYAAPVAAAPVLGAIGDESKYEVQP